MRRNGNRRPRDSQNALVPRLQQHQLPFSLFSCCLQYLLFPGSLGSQHAFDGGLQAHKGGLIQRPRELSTCSIPPDRFQGAAQHRRLGQRVYDQPAQRARDLAGQRLRACIAIALQRRQQSRARVLAVLLMKERERDDETMRSAQA